MKKIYIILMHTKTLPSKLVKAFTRYNYSHVAISLDPTCYETFSFGRKKVNNILDGGFSVHVSALRCFLCGSRCHFFR